MPDRSERELLEAMGRGDDFAFERIYDLYQQRVRLAAWSASHRPDWVEEIVSEAWIRAFRQRTNFDASRPFLVWMTGVVQNVYREACRKSPTTLGDVPMQDLAPRGGRDEPSPEAVASEAELLAALDDCVRRLGPEQSRLVRLRFFQGMTLRSVAKELNTPESTLREIRIPEIIGQLRRCLASKGVRVEDVFPAQGGAEPQ